MSLGRLTYSKLKYRFSRVTPEAGSDISTYQVNINVDGIGNDNEVT